MRIAITTSILRVPPTYFVVDHAQRLNREHDFRVFALAAQVADQTITVPVQDFGFGHPLPFAQRMRMAPLSIPAMTRAVRRFAPDLVHQHFATWSTPAVSAARANHSPLVTTLHGYDVFAANRAPHTALERWHHLNIGKTREQSARFLAVSEYLASAAMAAGFDPARLHVHYQGVDTDYFTPLVSAEPAEAVPIVLFVGSLTANKGLFDLIAASRAIAATTEHTLIIAGSGPLSARIHEETSPDRHIRMVGSLERRGVRDWMRRARVMVLPARGHNGRREAAGLVLLEAQACGLPVVAYASGGTPEMLPADSTGRLVAEGDVQALTAAVKSVLELTAADHASLARAGRQFVVTSRSLSVSADELSAHYAAVYGL